MNNDVYSVDEAAKILGLENSYVRRLLAKGEIKGKKLGRDWVILNLDYQRKRRPKGGQKSEKS
ncbi:MAG TPA: helix-turn-helix domain-containing protein [Dehalococcoidia bacterium]|nr:helix-turn-helix domain-containing protein [Dehalococcoidia bacterium]